MGTIYVEISAGILFCEIVTKLLCEKFHGFSRIRSMPRSQISYRNIFADFSFREYRLNCEVRKDFNVYSMQIGREMHAVSYTCVRQVQLVTKYMYVEISVGILFFKIVTKLLCEIHLFFPVNM